MSCCLQSEHPNNGCAVERSLSDSCVQEGLGGGQEVIEAVAVIRVRKEECFKEVWECGGRPGMKDVK